MPYCEEHKPDRSFLSSPEWKVARIAALNRDEYRCQAIDEGERCTKKAEDVDHILPRAQGGALLDIDNLVSMCKAHHSAKTRAEAQGAQAGAQALPPHHDDAHSTHDRVTTNLERKRAAMIMLEHGATDAEVMATVGVSASTATRWRATHERGRGHGETV